METNRTYFNKYGRQISDTSFYINNGKCPKADNKQRSLSEKVDHIRNGSQKNHNDNNDLFDRTYKSVRKEPSDRKRHGDSICHEATGQQLNDFKRSENVVRFHKDLVTDVHVDYRDKIQVDELGSKHSVNQPDYKADDFELYTHSSDNKKQDCRNGQISGELHIKSRQLSKKRKISKEPKGTESGSARLQNRIQTKDINMSETTQSNGYVSKTSLQYKGSKEDKHRRHGSPRKRHQRPKADTHLQNQNEIQNVKKSVTKTRSSSSTDSGRSASKSKRGDTYTLSVNELVQSSVDRKSSRRNGRELFDIYTGKVGAIDVSERNKQTLDKKRKRKFFCVCLSVIVTCVIGAAMVTGIVLYVTNRGHQEADDDGTRVYDMVNVHVRMRVLNENYTTMLNDSSSAHFRKFSVQMCNEVDVIYITSHMSRNYFGCRVIRLRAGSVQVYYVSPFLETLHTTNTSQHRDILLNNLSTLFSPDLPANTTVLGDFLVDANSIEVSIERFKTNKLPRKPKMPVRVTTTFRPSSFSSISATVVSSTSQKPTDVTQATIVKYLSTTVGEHSSTQFTVPTKPYTRQSTHFKERTLSTLEKTDVESTSAPVTVIIGASNTIDESTGSTMSTDKSSPSDTLEITTNTHIISEGLNVSVTVNGDEVFLQKQPTKIECLVKNSKGVISIKILHTDNRDSDIILKTVDGDELNEQRDRTSVLSRTKKLSVKFDATSIYLKLNFNKVSCKDVGLYICVVETKSGETIRANGYLNGTAKPSMPQLSLPIALIENKETRQPIMCTADVGFPNGQILWRVKPKGFSEFIPFDGHYISKSGKCDRFVTSSLVYTPTKDGNGTVLKCEVVNDFVPHSRDLSAVSDLYILSENLCIGVPVNTSIRHPTTCTKYIRCNGNRFEVRECENRMCYDEEADRCGKTQLKMNDVTAFLNEGVTSLQCRLNHLGVWNNITISKLLPDGNTQAIVTIKSRGRENTVYNSDMKDRIFVHQESPQDFEVKINVWVYILTCADEGVYKCQAYTPSEIQEVTARLDLRGKPDAPKISIPNEIIEGVPLRKNITCQANVGYPEGRLLLTMKYLNESDFNPINLNITTEKIVQNCSKLVRKSFTFIPTLNDEKMRIGCEVENEYTLPINKKLVAMETLHVIPKNFCSIRGSETPQVHPHDCHQYVQCSEGYTYVQRCGSNHCFNPLTLHCDLEVEDKQEPFDPKHPCLPDKNGVFFHHPILCNKYIWCVQGQEVVHHCPLGTLYIDGGQCTFEPEKSRCYQDQNKDIR